MESHTLPRARRRALWLVLAAVTGISIALPVAIPTSAQEAPRAATAAPEAPPPSPAAQAAIADAQRVGNAFATVAERVAPSVVSIRVEARVERSQAMPMPFRFFGPQGQQGEDESVVQGGGSGFVIAEDGAILTNRHVIENATRIRIVFQDGRDLPATIVGVDRATDLAVLRVQARGLRPLRFADMERQRVGQWVVAIGSPFGLDMTVTAGVLSAVGRAGIGMNEIEDYVQTDASINPGNSGGPLVNLDGEVVGVNSMILGRGQGIGFAIPSDMAQGVAEQLVAHGRVQRSWIGVGFQELTPELAADLGATGRRGALINQIVEGGPAARAGLVAGDAVVAIDGTTVHEGRDLFRRILRRPIGSELRLEVLRNGRSQTLTVRTAERPDARAERDAIGEATPERPQADRAGLGVELTPMTPAIAQQLRRPRASGVVVVRVRQGGHADRAGLQRGDVIVEADHQPVRTVADVEQAMRDGHALVRAERGESAFYAMLGGSE